MAEEDDKDSKTEDATPHKRQEAREEGQVPLSTEVIVAMMLCLGLAVIVLGGGWIARSAGELLESSIHSLAMNGTQELSVRDADLLVSDSARSVAFALLLVAVPLFLGAGLVAYAQVGLRITPKATRWDPSKLNPFSGFSRLFSTRSFVRAALALAKIVVIAITMGVLAWGELPDILRLTGSDLGPLLVGLGSVLLRCTVGALIAIVSIAIADFFYQRWQHERDLRMSRTDIKNELKNTEADPRLKARVRQVQREMARRRMMADVPKATVIVTNPTHYAVALRYEREPEPGPDGRRRARRAPYVVAKGVDAVAQKIKAVARDANIVLYEDVPLARALHREVEIGEEIPEAFYQAVASVLAYVYRVQGEVVHA
jgi:flagellar biosynthetic protein FlhB